MYIFAFVISITILLILIFNIDYGQCYEQNNHDNINALSRQMYRWYIASTQDNEVIIKNLHSNYAMGYLSALRNIATDDEIYNVTNLDMKKIALAISKQQDVVLIEFASICPALIPDDDVYRDYLTQFLPIII